MPLDARNGMGAVIAPIRGTSTPSTSVVMSWSLDVTF